MQLASAKDRTGRKEEERKNFEYFFWLHNKEKKKSSLVVWLRACVYSPHVYHCVSWHSPTVCVCVFFLPFSLED